MSDSRKHTLTVTDGEASSHARVDTDVWEQALEEWLPVQLDGATREHFRSVTHNGHVKAKADSGSRRGIASGDWLLEDAGQLNLVWGTQDAPLFLEGEGFMIVGPPGVGKTTIGGQFVLALAGIHGMCLGLPVRPERGKVLYLAMDRPDQIKRSFQRMITEDDRDALAERIVFWRGPLDFEPLKEPERLAQFAHEHGATHIVVDSYKDMALKLSDDEVGGLFNRTMQVCVAEGVGWTGLHHDRKPTGENKRPNSLADVYGSAWLTAGVGSVLGLWGEAGDEVVEARHLKPPAESLGTFNVRHDHAAGNSWITDDDAPERDGRKKGKAERQAAVADFLQGRPELATVNDANAKAVKEALGLDIGDQTVERDLRDLERATNRADGRKDKKLAADVLDRSAR
jgi:hypothetical protein